METKQLEVFNPFKQKLIEFKSRYDEIVYDLNDKKQEKQARSDRRAIGSVISDLDKSHAKIKAPLLEHVRVIDGARKEIKDQLLAVQNKIKDQIKTHEEAIEKKEKELQRRIDDISGLTLFDVEPGSFEIKQHLDSAKETKIVNFEHRTDEAIEIRDRVIEVLERMLSQALKYEKDQEELKRLREENEERAKRESAEKMRMEEEERAKRMSIEAIEAARKALEEKHRREIEEAKEAEKRAKHQAMIAAEMAVQEERKRIEEERIERERIAIQEENIRKIKSEREEHQNKINLEIIADFSRQGFDVNDTKAYIKAINGGSIRHIKIEY
jgi:hypothetical protein